MSHLECQLSFYPVPQEHTWDSIFFPSAVCNKSLSSFKKSHEDWKNFPGWGLANNSLVLGQKLHPSEIFVPSSFMLIIVMMIQAQKISWKWVSSFELMAWHAQLGQWVDLPAVNSREIPWELVTVGEIRMFLFSGFYAHSQRTLESQFNSFMKLGNAL